MKFTIQRSKWLLGEGPRESYLIRASDQKMCCLGFFGLACGLEPERLTNVKTPVDTYWSKPKMPEADALFKGSLLTQLMCTNDRNDFSESEREEGIAAKFSQMGVQVEFVD